ncbi:MAG: glycosyltransferase [Chitinophagales bacterium]|nr:glycosyltransferase [Chitinophagales bacterium]
MKKVLILAYDFPPYVSVGAQRPYSWYLYLKEFGVEPIVVTRQWSNKHGNALDYIEASESAETIVEETEYGTIIRAPYFPSLANKIFLAYGEHRFNFIRKLITAYYEILQYFMVFGPKKELYFAAKEYLKKNRVDVILASGEPFVLFYFAQKLSKEFHTPWVAEYRDPWIQNKSRGKGLLKSLNAFIEKRTLKGAASAITVSQFCIQQIQENIVNLPFHIVMNGYNPEMINAVAAVKQKKDILRIGFAGTIYSWHPWKSFLRVLNRWKKNNPESNLEVHFFGINIADELITFVESEIPFIQSAIFVYPRMPNLDLMRVLKEFNLLLLFNDYSFLGTKIFDYLALQRQILMCYEADEEAVILKRKYYSVEESSYCSKRLQAETIEAVNSGIIVKDSEHLYEVFDKLWEEFIRNGEIACNSTGAEKYSRKIQAEKLAQIIQELV